MDCSKDNCLFSVCKKCQMHGPENTFKVDFIVDFASFQPEHTLLHLLQVWRLLLWHAAASRLATGHKRRSQKSHTVKGNRYPQSVFFHCLFKQQTSGSLSTSPVLKLSGCRSCAITVTINSFLCLGLPPANVTCFYFAASFKAGASTQVHSRGSFLKLVQRCRQTTTLV